MKKAPYRPELLLDPGLVECEKVSPSLGERSWIQCPAFFLERFVETLILPPKKIFHEMTPDSFSVFSQIFQIGKNLFSPFVDTCSDSQMK